MNREEAIASLSRKKKLLTQEAFVNTARNGVPHLLLEYLAAGFDPNVPDEKNVTVLAAAVQRNDAEMVRLLLEHGAQPGDAELFFTAIWNAPFVDSVEIIDLLYAAGCPIHFIEQTTGFDGLALARDMGNRKIIARLEQIYGGASPGRKPPTFLRGLVVERVPPARKWWQFWK